MPLLLTGWAGGSALTFQPGMATWVNAYSIIQYIKANQTAPNDPATLALKVNKNGLMSAQRTPTCP